MKGSTINERFTTFEAAHFSVHFCCGDTSSGCGSSSHTGRRDVRRTSGWDECLLVLVLPQTHAVLAAGLLTTSIPTAAIFNRGSVEPKGSTSICHGFCGWSVKKAKK